MAIFNSYVKLPEGNGFRSRFEHAGPQCIGETHPHEMLVKAFPSNGYQCQLLVYSW
jgi:hypothetical protein